MSVAVSARNPRHRLLEAVHLISRLRDRLAQLGRGARACTRGHIDDVRAVAEDASEALGTKRRHRCLHEACLVP